MTYIKRAIEEAVEKGGYTRPHDWDIGPVNISAPNEQIFLDPAFWQALGRAQGWLDFVPSKYDYNVEIPEWSHHWHRFIEHLICGKDAESFFKSLYEK